ncbi:MAG TPA: phosphoenolpyruvate carboxykinase (ATP) [Candidatus Limnocylindrales bacterium]|jgi:phosphoenolpyruvate carboxykinase (ATP)|nr:phosphoenolpyruvate carboxykinase (ATP) [Candidatus Limnocylindrales bacterium]
MATTQPVRPAHPPTPGAGRARPPLGRHIRANLPTAELVEDAIRRGEGLIAAEGPLVVRTGKHTGRSPQDKFIVDEPTSHDKIWWGEVNRPISEAHYDRLRARLVAYCAERDLYSQDLLIGADPAHQRRLRVITESAWASIFARNLFRRTTATDRIGFQPNFTIINVPSFQADPSTEGTRTGTAILLHLERMEIIIVGTEYAGEIKKSAFTVMNYLMPDEGVLPMHSSVNVGRDGDSAVFFGLSGTGKTTLSADPERSLIGDDEHGWGDAGLFNFEGGCYAKTIRLSPMYEPDIFQTTRRFGTVLENVDLDPETRELDLDSERFTENTRGAYPLHFIGNADPTGMTGQPRTVILLTADAFGVLPPIARLTHDQAAYHFISGYTAKLAGTEVGVKEPKATFSTCFGAPFMPRHPGEYAGMLTDRLAAQDAQVWLVNTGWTGGPYGTGERMNIAHTRSMVRAALDGRLATVPTRLDPVFGIAVPTSCPDVPSSFLDPRSTWADRQAYDRQAARLAAMFVANFDAYADRVGPGIAAAGPVIDPATPLPTVDGDPTAG